MNSIKEIMVKNNLVPAPQKKEQPIPEKPQDESYLDGLLTVTHELKDSYGQKVWYRKPSVDIAKLKTQIDLEKVVPFRFKLAQFDDTKYHNITQEGRSYLFTGGVGTGKTFAMQEVANVFTLQKFANSLLQRFGYAELENGLPSVVSGQKIYTTSEISKLLKDEFDQKIYGDGLLDKLIKADVVFIDDLGIENVTDWWLEQFGFLINERYNWNRPLVLSTNLDIKDGSFAKVYGDRITSRLIQMCEIISFKGKDRRLG